MMHGLVHVIMILPLSGHAQRLITGKVLFLAIGGYGPSVPSSDTLVARRQTLLLPPKTFFWFKTASLTAQ